MSFWLVLTRLARQDLVRADTSFSGPGRAARAVADGPPDGAVSVLRLQEASVPWAQTDRTAAD